MLSYHGHFQGPKQSSLVLNGLSSLGSGSKSPRKFLDNWGRKLNIIYLWYIVSHQRRLPPSLFFPYWNPWGHRTCWSGTTTRICILQQAHTSICILSRWECSCNLRLLRMSSKLCLALRMLSGGRWYFIVKKGFCRTLSNPTTILKEHQTQKTQKSRQHFEQFYRM